MLHVAIIAMASTLRAMASNLVAFLLLVMPGATSSVLATSSDALVTRSDGLQPIRCAQRCEVVHHVQPETMRCMWDLDNAEEAKQISSQNSDTCEQIRNSIGQPEKQLDVV